MNQAMQAPTAARWGNRIIGFSPDRMLPFLGELVDVVV